MAFVVDQFVYLTSNLYNKKNVLAQKLAKRNVWRKVWLRIIYAIEKLHMVLIEVLVSTLWRFLFVFTKAKCVTWSPFPPFLLWPAVPSSAWLLPGLGRNIWISFTDYSITVIMGMLEVSNRTLHHLCVTELFTPPVTIIHYYTHHLREVIMNYHHHITCAVFIIHA